MEYLAGIIIGIPIGTFIGYTMACKIGIIQAEIITEREKQRILRQKRASNYMMGGNI